VAKIADGLKGIDLCGPGCTWVGSRTDTQATWDECTDGSWLLGLCYALAVDAALIVSAARACAALALPTLTEPRASRTQLGIDKIDSWTGRLTSSRVKQAIAVALGAARLGLFPPKIDADLLERYADTIRATIPWSAVAARFAEDRQGNLTPVA